MTTKKYQKRLAFLKGMRKMLDEMISLGAEDYGIVDNDVWDALMEDIKDDVLKIGEDL